MIVDIDGNEFPESALKSPQSQSPEISWLPRTYQNHPSRGLTPQRLAGILEKAERFWFIEQAELWADMREKWGHLDAEMSKRERAILTLDWDIVAPEDANRNERKAADFVKDFLEGWMPDPLLLGDDRSTSFDDILLGCADAIGNGFSAQEMTWERQGTTWLPVNIVQQPASWFCLDIPTHRQIRLRSMEPGGSPLMPYGWIVHIHKARAGYVSRSGLVRSLAWPYIFANYSIRDLAELLEIFGIPIRIGKHPANATRTDKMKLLDAVVGIGKNAGGVIPDNMAIEIEKNVAQGSGDAFKLMIEWAESTASNIITGQSNHDGRTATHSLERQEIKVDLLTTDARQIERTISGHLCWPIVHLNGLNVERNRAPRLKFDTRQVEDIKLLAESLPKLVAVGAKIPLHYVNDKTKIPIPDDAEPILTALPPVKIPNVDTDSMDSTNVQLAAAKAARLPEPDRSPVTIYADQLADNAAPHLEKWILVIRKEVMAASSLDDLRDRLLSLYGHLDSKKMADVMGTAFACARLAGRYDVKKESGL